MDQKELSHRLRMVGKDIPRSLKASGIVQSKPLERQGEIIRKMLATGKFNGKLVRKEDLRTLDKMYNQGGYDKIVETIDQKVSDKIEHQTEEIIKHKIFTGELPNPKDLINNDSFLKNILKNQ